MNGITDLSAGTLTDGAYQVDDGTTLDLAIGGTVTALGGTITLGGPNSALLQYDTLDNAYDQSIESTLAAILATGTLALLAGRSWTSALALTDAGVLQLGGGVFTTPSLDVNGAVLGYGTLATPTTNSGTIEAAGGILTVAAALHNTALLQVDSGAELLALTPIINAGSIVIAAAGTLDLDYQLPGAFGLVSNAGTLVVTGSYGLADFTGLTGAGQVDLTGTLDLNGATLVVAAGTPFSDVVISGEVIDGTIEYAGGTLSLPGATLDGVTYRGATLAPAPASTLTILGGLTVETASGGTPGTIDLTASGSTLLFADTQTLDNVALLLGGATAATLATDSTLTLGAGVTGVQTGGTIDFYAASIGEAIINDGSLDLASGEAVDFAASLENAGTLTLGAGERVDNVNGTYVLENLAGGVITVGGTVVGGIVAAPDGGVFGAGGTLDGGAFEGDAGSVGR